MENRIAWLNGAFVPENEAKVPIGDRGFLFGEGVFTTVRVEGGIALWLDEHFARLQSHARVLGIAEPMLQKSFVEELIRANNALLGVWKLKIVVTAVTLLMTIERYFPPKRQVLKLVCYPYPVERPSARIKSLAYLDNRRARAYARAQGCDEAVLLSVAGKVLETAAGNLCWERGGVVYTPAPTLPRLDGIALRKHLEGAVMRGLAIAYVEALPEEIPADAALFVTNSMLGAHPASF